jgi:ATP-dependent Lon protease
MAAAPAGLCTVVLPRRNTKDVVEIPPEVLEKLELRFVDTLDEVLAVALES